MYARIYIALIGRSRWFSFTAREKGSNNARPGYHLVRDLVMGIRLGRSTWSSVNIGDPKTNSIRVIRDCFNLAIHLCIFFNILSNIEEDQHRSRVKILIDEEKMCIMKKKCTILINRAQYKKNCNTRLREHNHIYPVLSIATRWRGADMESSPSKLARRSPGSAAGNARPRPGVGGTRS